MRSELSEVREAPMMNGLPNSTVVLLKHFPGFPLHTGTATTTNQYDKYSIH